MKIKLTQAQKDKRPSYAIGKVAGQKSVGSGDPDNEFSIVTTPNYDKDGVFLKTYTVEIPDGRATDAQVQAILDDPNPEQQPIEKTRMEVLADKIKNDTDSPDEFREYIKLRDNLV